MHTGYSYAWLRLFCLLTIVVALMQPYAAAAESIEKKIVAIETSGNRYVESAAILANIESKVGESLSRKQISRDVRALFKTGYFEDVHVEGIPENGGVRLVYVVKENPLIAELKILDNDEIPDKDLKPKLELKPGRVFSEAKLRKDRNTIRKSYLKKGYYQVDVTAEKVMRDDGRVDLTLHVNEGSITHIKRIQFIGNEAFSDETLRTEVISRQSDLFSWFTSRDVFDRERFGGDSQMLQQYYMNNGYLDMKIESAQLSLTPDKESFYLTFSLFEGPKYTIDQTDLQGDLVPSREALLKAITFEKGDTYSVTELRKAIEAMELVVGDEGYAFVSVTPLFQRDVEGRKLSITFDIEKGQEVYVERIEVSGNQKTSDEVARRELRQYEGERYNASAVKRSKDRLKRLQLFKDVRINLDKQEQPDRVKMNVELEDDKTGSFSLGAGYSQVEKVFLTASVQEKNFLGKGYTTNVSADVGAATQNFSVVLSDPYFLGSEVSATLNLFKSQTKPGDVVGYQQNSFGGGISFGVPITEFFSYSVGYQYNHSKLTDIPLPTSILLLAQQGVQTTGEVIQYLTWDNRDRTVAPTSGHQEQLGASVAGVGGQNRFYELSFSSKSYFSLTDELVLNPSFVAKTIAGYSGKDVPIYRRYSIGGIGTVRGFDAYGISLRDPLTGEAIGGDKLMNASVNLFFPIPYMETTGVRGALFADAGIVWGSVNTTVGVQTLNVAQNFSAANIRTSAGIGIEWMSPVGPLSLAWSIPIHKVQGDLERTFEFALGASF